MHTNIVNAVSLMMNKFVDDVETTIEKHLNEFKPVVHAKIWKNHEKNKNQKICLYQFSLSNKLWTSMKSVFNPCSILCICFGL